MGRRETVVFVCDWCAAEAKPERVYGEDHAPETWEEHDCTLLCGSCVAARKVALQNAEAAQRARATQHKCEEQKEKHGT